MKLTELVGVKQDLATASYTDVLQQKGFAALGSGSFATAWAHPDLDYVLKTFKASDTSYLEWLAACRSNQQNPFIPRFISPKPVQVVPGILAIRMEKLTHASAAAKPILDKLEDVINEVTIEADQPTSSTRTISRIIKESYPALADYAAANKGLIPAISLIADIINNGSGVNDLNVSNIMMRGQQMVFTDPV